MTHSRSPALVLGPLVALLAFAVSACGDSHASHAASPDAAARSADRATSAASVKMRRVTVTVNPGSATLAAGASATFSATVTGAADSSVSWSVAPAGCGSVTSTGAYTAPAAAASCQVVATSHADIRKSAAAAVTVTAPAPTAVAVTVTPATAAVDACTALSFSATVTGSTDTAVTWSVQEGSSGGTVSTMGVYTAPSTAGTYHLVATSQADPTKSQVAVVTVADRIVSVTVAPGQLTVPPGGTAQFTATVTTTCGAFTQTSALATN